MRWSRATTRTLVKLAAFAIACVVVAGWLVARIGNVQLFSDDVGYRAQLSDATGLAPGDAVKISGVTVGRVNSVGARHGYALVSFDVEPDVHLRSTTGVGMQWLDVIGDKVLYLYPGSSGRVLRPGATLPLSNDVGDASIGALLNTLGPFLQAIDPTEQDAFLAAVAGTLQGDGVKVHQLVDHTAEVAGTVGSVSGQLGVLIDNLDTVVSAVAHRRSDLAGLSNDLAALSGTLAANNGLVDSTVGNLGRAEQDLAGLLQRNSANLGSLIANLKGLSADLDAHGRALALTLHDFPAGLAPYQEISSYGQWFEIDPVFTCLANQTACSYQQPTNEPGASEAAPSRAGAGRGTGGAGNLGAYFGTLSGGG
ncbi:MAG TPA: MlaD family protein [Acidimicrobiales bacterium]|nr:MlaD family protein [Acidimicrobiales bacterium]